MNHAMYLHFDADGNPCVHDPVARFVVKPMDATRCVVCGHRLDDMGGCDSCAGDREAAEIEGYFDE